MMVRLMFPLVLHNTEQRIAASGAKKLIVIAMLVLLVNGNGEHQPPYCLSNAL
jgi:hypothetical protein